VLAARVAHDFANLLAPVLGNVALLEKELPEGHPLQQRLLGMREAALAGRAYAQRLALLDTRRKPSLHHIEIGAVVRGCLPALREQLRPGIVIEILPNPASDAGSNPASVASPRVPVDARQIERALVELARNADDAMDGKGSLHIDIESVEGGTGDLPAGHWVRLRVRDTGRGMEPSLLAHAFEPFVTTKVPAGGFGLGLSVVAGIVRQHGGFVDAESRPGEGTTISIYLPNEGSGQQAHVTPVSSSPEETSASSSVLKASVLLVEDNPMVRRSIEVTLRAAGCQVTSVDSGERCIAAVARLDVPMDLLISDVVMPEMSGKEMVARVRELRPGLPVLFISGYDRSSLARRNDAVVTEHFLQKPFDSEDLFAAVREALLPQSGQRGG